MKNHKGTWLQALTSLAISIAVVMAFRWAFFEPYVIPSGSMFPNLLIHDHILVNKFAYGLRFPFTKMFFWKFSQPKRGEIVVFRSVDNDDLFLVKRVVGLPGDHLRVLENGVLEVNGQLVGRDAASAGDVEKHLATVPPAERESLLQGMSVWKEQIKTDPVLILQEERPRTVGFEVTVPADHIFMMGDNRDNSSDSRIWGALPMDHILGRAVLIWLSCEETLPDAAQLCDPKTIRWKRMFQLL